MLVDLSLAHLIHHHWIELGHQRKIYFQVWTLVSLCQSTKTCWIAACQRFGEKWKGKIKELKRRMQRQKENNGQVMCWANEMQIRRGLTGISLLWLAASWSGLKFVLKFLKTWIAFYYHMVTRANCFRFKTIFVARNSTHMCAILKYHVNFC